MILALIGGIGSGKSTFARLFALHKIPVYDSDSRAAYLMNHDPYIARQLIDLLGDKAYIEQRINKPFLSKIFQDLTLTQKVNAIVHPIVRSDFKKWVSMHKEPWVVVETALLFTAGLDQDVDRIVSVEAPLSLRKERVMQRSALSVDQIDQRIAMQSQEALAWANVPYKIINDGEHSLIKQFYQLLRSLPLEI